MGGVQLIGAEHAARGRDVQRHSTGQEGTDLIGGGLRTHHHVGADETGGVLGLIALDVEGVLHLAGRMVRAEIQGVEVVPFGFDFRAGGDLPAHGDEEVLDVLHQLRQRVTGAQRLTAHRQRHIHGFGGKRGLLGGFLELDLLGTIGAAEVGAQLAHNLAGVFLLVLRQRADGLAGLRHRGFRSGVLRLDGFQFLHAGGVFDFRDALGNRIGYRLGVEYRTLCHEIPFLSTVCFTHKTRNSNVFTTSHSFNMTRHSQAQQHHRRTGAEIERFRLAVDGNRHDSVDAFQHILGQPARLVAEQHRLGLRK